MKANTDLLCAVSLLRAEVLQGLRPEVRVAALCGVAQPHARVDDGGVVASRQMELYPTWKARNALHKS